MGRPWRWVACPACLGCPIDVWSSGFAGMRHRRTTWRTMAQALKQAPQRHHHPYPNLTQRLDPSPTTASYLPRYLCTRRQTGQRFFDGRVRRRRLESRSAQRHDREAIASKIHNKIALAIWPHTPMRRSANPAGPSVPLQGPCTASAAPAPHPQAPLPPEIARLCGLASGAAGSC